MSAPIPANDRAPPSRRHRALFVLGAVPLLVAAGAGIAMMQQTQEMAPKFTPRPLFPALASHANEIGEITITTKEASFHIRLQKDKGWIVPERNGFPANVSALKALVAGMANLEAVEPKTSRADWLDLLALGAPDKGGEATRVALSDTAGKPMADLLVGRIQVNADGQGRNDIYVRRTGENQVWRARGFLTLTPQIGEWLDRSIMNVTHDRIATVTVTPVVGPSYSVVRTTKDQADFQLLDMPKGRELTYSGVADSVATAITHFTFDDVASVADVDFSKAIQHTTRTFDGLIVTTKVAPKDGAQWANVSAQASTTEKQAESAAINARTAAWAFKLPQFKAEMFSTTRDSLLKPLGGASAANPPPSFPGALQR